MTLTKMLSIVWIGVLAVSLTSAGQYYIKRNSMQSCDFRGYAPGGKVKQVSQVTAPTAELAKTGIANVIAGLGSKGSATGAAVATAVGEFVEKFAKVAPKLGAALGLFSAVFSLFSDEPGPDDILNSVNDALSDLTREVNQKLDSMMGYVDTRVINSEREMLENQFSAQHRRWKFCLKEETQAQSTDCQTDAAKRLVEDRPIYAIYERKVMNLLSLDSFERRKMEANLLLFRNYANMVVLELLPLVEVFCADPSKAHDCRRFSTDLHTEMTFLIKYAQNAVQLIENFHGNRGACPNTVSCGPQKAIKEGNWFTGKKHTMNEFDCQCVIDDSNTKQYCNFKAYIRRDGKFLGTNNGWWVYNYPECHDRICGSRRFAELTFWGEAMHYQNKNLPVVKKYWETAVLNMVPEWQKVLIKAESRMGDAANDEEAFDTLLDQPSLSWLPYSAEYKAREEKLKKLGASDTSVDRPSLSWLPYSAEYKAREEKLRKLKASDNFVEEKLKKQTVESEGLPL